MSQSGPQTLNRLRACALTLSRRCALLLFGAFPGLGAISGICAVTLLLGVFTHGARGAESPSPHFPNRPLTLVVGAAAGGGIDINARLLAFRLADYFGQSVIVENRPGAGSTMADTQLILVVNPSVPVKNMRELIARARSMPGKLNYSSSGPGTTGHLCGELFKLRTATDIVHIPFKGTAPSLNALIAGDVDMSFASVPGVLQYIRAGQLRPLATTGERRSEVTPEVPTMKEAGASDMEASVWYGVLAPATTSPEVVNILSRAIAEASSSPDFRRRLLDLGEEPVAASPEEFARHLREEVAKWGEVIKAAGIRAD